MRSKSIRNKKRYSHTAPEGSAVHPCGCTGSIFCNKYSTGRWKDKGKFRMILFCMRRCDRLDAGLRLRYTGAEGRR